MRNKLTISIFFFLLTSAVFAIAPQTKQKQSPQDSAKIKLEYRNPYLRSEDYKLQIAPIPMSSDRLLVPVGDALYMLDSKNRIVWHYSFDPNIIRDVMVDAKGDIYIAASEALILVLDSSGKEIWRTGMSSGSAWYSQIKSYGDGFLVIVDMEAYRLKGQNSEDILEFWRDRKQEWSKTFPRGARLHVAGNRILAIATTQQGREITEIR